MYPDKVNHMDNKAVRKTALQAVDTIPLQLERSLRCLSVRHIHAIDDALVAIGAYGEVRLIKNGGKLRFIQTVKSEDLATRG